MSGPERKPREVLRRADFLRATRCGRRFETGYFRVFVHWRGDEGATRLGITVTRKVGKAVRRNLIKRLVREWFRQRDRGLGACDLIVIAKRELPRELRLQQVLSDLDRALAGWEPPLEAP